MVGVPLMAVRVPLYGVVADLEGCGSRHFGPGGQLEGGVVDQQVPR